MATVKAKAAHIERPRTNAPEPVYFPALPDPWRKYLRQFLQFCDALTIEPKDSPPGPLILLASQRYAIEEMFDGFAHGIHDFTILKARQLGLSTLLWAFDLFWLTKFSLQAMYVADSEPNKEIHRDIIAKMYASLPRKWSRGPVRANNRLELAWADTPTWRASRLMWGYANQKTKGQLGRSRGFTFGHFEELDSWTDASAMGSIDAARSHTHPRRFYAYVGTGQGYGQLYDLWEQAKHSTSSRAIFIGFWRNPKYVLSRDERAKWDVYGRPAATPDEMEWAREVKKRYTHIITREQVAYWRYIKAEGKGINGDEAKALQEYPWIPEHAFQASGAAFLSPMVCLRLRRGAENAPPASYYRFEWGAAFDAKDEPVVACARGEATLTVWEEKKPLTLYIVSGDPAYGSSAQADSFAATVWRVHPDTLVQVAEYDTPSGAMYEFAWVLAYLTGYYEKFLIYEVNGPGMAVLQELRRMADTGRGLLKRHGKLQDVIGNIQHYLQSRPDAMNPSFNWQHMMTEATRDRVLEQLKNEAERGTLVVRSTLLAAQLAALRRDPDTGRVAASGIAHDDLAITAALAVEHWLGAVLEEIEGLVAPEQPDDALMPDPAQRALRHFLSGLHEPEEAPEALRTWGVQVPGPGR